MSDNFDDMRLPAHMTCRDCVHFARCVAFLGLKGDEVTCDWAPSRFRLDTVGVLCRLLKEGGATLTLYGESVSEQELRDFTTTVAVERIKSALERNA